MLDCWHGMADGCWLLLQDMHGHQAYAHGQDALRVPPPSPPLPRLLAALPCFRIALPAALLACLPPAASRVLPASLLASALVALGWRAAGGPASPACLSLTRVLPLTHSCVAMPRRLSWRAHSGTTLPSASAPTASAQALACARNAGHSPACPRTVGRAGVAHNVLGNASCRIVSLPVFSCADGGHARARQEWAKASGGVMMAAWWQHVG